MREHTIICKILLCLSLLLVSSCDLPTVSFGSKNTEPRTGSKSRNKSDIEIGSDLDDKGAHYASLHFAPSHIGFIVYDTDARQVLFSHNKRKTFIPASTTKIPTIITAFDVLGDDFTFKTSLYIDGSLDKGELEGDLYLKGYGDPYLKVCDLAEIARMLKKHGIDRVSGNFYYDKSELTNKRILDKTMDLDQAYNTGVSALSTEFNYVNAHWSSLNGNKEPSLVLSPDLPMLDIKNAEKELQEEINFEHNYEGNKSVWSFSQNRDKRGSQRIPLRRPSLYTAQLFRKIAQVHGVSLPSPKHCITPSKAKEIVAYKSKSLTEICSTIMEYSVNMMAELLFLQTAKKIEGKKLSYSMSSEVIENYHKSLFTKVDWKGLSLVNGSGLTSKNRISPEQMLAFLIYADSKRFAGKEFEYFLQASGWGWSLKRRFHRPSSSFRIYAKTGTIDYAVALAGHLYTHSGKRLLFVFFNDDKRLRYLYEHDPKQRDEKAQKAARKWRWAYISAMDTIISRWIHEL